MPNLEQNEILKKGVNTWNHWRLHNPEMFIDLSGANLYGADLSGANLSEAYLHNAILQYADLSEADLFRANLHNANLHNANLSRAILHEADLSEADLHDADLSGANLHGADLSRANLYEADLSGANLSEAYLHNANLHNANLSRANLRRASLKGAVMLQTNFKEADLNGANIYGISAWDLIINQETKQNNLIITKAGESEITVDNLEVAQFIYLLLTNEKIRDVINTVGRKAVLILGRFTKERKEVLDAIADQLRTMDLLPIMFDFQKSEEQDIIETVITLAGMSKFIIADVTAARVIADELRAFVPDFAIPVVLLFQPSKKEPKPYASLYTLYKKYDWVFKPVEYQNKEHLIKILPTEVIEPAEEKRLELLKIK